MSDVVAAPLPQRTGRRGRRRARSCDEGKGKRAKVEETPTEGESGVGESFADFPYPAQWERAYEYLDHTADIQIHAWGADVARCFEQAAVGMFGYMTELETVDIDPTLNRTVRASGHDMESLLYHFMDEWLFVFSSEYFMPRYIHVTELDEKEWTITSRGVGETFDLAKHPQGTEIKAITYSNLQVFPPGAAAREDDLAELYIIVDI